MSIFNLFKKEKRTESAFVAPMFGQQELPSEPSAENVEEENDNKSDNKTLTVSYATGWPIDVIYGYLQATLPSVTLTWPSLETRF